MAIELHHLHPGHDDELSRLKARIAELEEERRWRKFSEEKPKWGEEVIVVDDESKQYIVRFSHDMKWISWGRMNTCESNCVKYWMPLPSAPKEEKMIKPGKLNGYLVAIKEELRKVEGKHPKFCDKMTNCVSADFMKKSELLYKKFNSKPPYSAESILEEEIREALSAYLEGDKVHTLEELAQCGAVIIRMMDFVSKEIDKEMING